MFLPVAVLVADGDAWEINLFHIFYFDIYIGFILKENCYSASHLSSEQDDGCCKSYEPQKPASISLALSLVFLAKNGMSNVNVVRKINFK